MRIVEVKETIEELEINGDLVSVDVTLRYEVFPGTPKVMPNPRNEVGYPGDPAEAYFLEYEVEAIEGDDGIYEGDADKVIEVLEAREDWESRERIEAAFDKASEDEEGEEEARAEAYFEARHAWKAGEGPHPG